MLKVINR